MEPLTLHDLLETMDAILRCSGDVPSIVQTADVSTCVSIAMAVFVVNALYGMAMGWSDGLRQAFASAIKLPVVFLGTLAICLPVLIVGSRIFCPYLTPTSVTALVLSALLLCGTIAVSFATIVLFFGISTGYDFMKLMHVSVLGISGIFSLGCQWIWVTILTRGTGASEMFVLWLAAFGFVGCQFSWSLRPIIGSPDLPFQWFRPNDQGMNFYSALLLSFRRLKSTGAIEIESEPHEAEV